MYEFKKLHYMYVHMYEMDSWSKNIAANLLSFLFALYKINKSPLITCR